MITLRLCGAAGLASLMAAGSLAKDRPAEPEGPADEQALRAVLTSLETLTGRDLIRSPSPVADELAPPRGAPSC